MLHSLLVDLEEVHRNLDPASVHTRPAVVAAAGPGILLLDKAAGRPVEGDNLAAGHTRPEPDHNHPAEAVRSHQAVHRTVLAGAGHSPAAVEVHPHQDGMSVARLCYHRMDL